MGTYAPASAFGWLDLDAAASERAATLLRAFEEPGTLDPLGFGAIRDVFSNLFAPGTSTIQTRLRYFLFVPWVCQDLERRRVSSVDFLSQLRENEARLIDCLRHLGPNRGVQGYTAGQKLIRMPSAAYWGGLRSWGLRHMDLSIAEYGRQIGHFARRRVELDDDRNPVTQRQAIWATLPDPPEQFLAAQVDFDLTLDEATLLIDQIRRNHPGSLLAETCSFATEASAAAQPWDLPLARLSAPLRASLHHARCVSELTLGPQLLYNMLLARRAESELEWDTSEVTAGVEADLVAWVDMVAVRATELQKWADEIDVFWAFLALHDSIATPTVAFVTEMVTRAAADPEAFIEDRAVHNLIRDREIRLKGSRARLGPRAALEGWNRARFGGQLVYRWPIARSYLEDFGAAMTEVP